VEKLLILALCLLCAVIVWRIELWRHARYKRKKGEWYEKFVGKRYEKEGYEVLYHGLRYGIHDQGIDLIARKGESIHLIQCKNWSAFGSLNVKEIKAFYGSCALYIESHQLHGKKIERILAIPDNRLLTTPARELFKKHFKRFRYRIINTRT